MHQRAVSKVGRSLFPHIPSMQGWEVVGMKNAGMIQESQICKKTLERKAYKPIDVERKII